MYNEEADSQDCLFIAQHVLTKLDIPVDPSNVSKAQLPMDRQVKSATNAIEEIEDTWEYQTDPNNHSFGRKEKNEIIKLWSVPNKSAHVLRNLVILTGAKRILEIGTSAGYSTLFLAEGARQTGGHVTTIELLHEKIDLAKKYFGDSGLGNIELIEAEASKVIQNWDRGEIDLVFLDADKENYGKYFNQLMPHLKKGAIIVADNINDYGHMMTDYLQKVTGTHLPKSRSDKRVSSYYLAALDNGLMFTKKL